MSRRSRITRRDRRGCREADHRSYGPLGGDRAAPGLSLHALDAERNETRDRTSSAGNDDLLTGFGAPDQLGESGLGIVDIDFLAHWSDLTNSERRRGYSGVHPELPPCQRDNHLCYHPLHNNMCSEKGRVLPGLFLFWRENTGGRGCDGVQATDRQAGQTEELSALQFRQDGRDCAVQALPVQVAGAHRQPLEGIGQREEWVVAGALRAAANYFDIHYKSIRHFRGGRIRGED